MSEASYRKLTPPIIIIACFLAVIGFIYPAIVGWAFLALVIFLVVNIIFYNIRIKTLDKTVSIDNYDITTEVVHSKSEEHYKAEAAKHRKNQ